MQTTHVETRSRSLKSGLDWSWFNLLNNSFVASKPPKFRDLRIFFLTSFFYTFFQTFFMIGPDQRQIYFLSKHKNIEADISLRNIL